MLRVGTDPDAHRDGERLRIAELDACLLERLAERGDDRLHLGGVDIRPDDEELVGTVARDVPAAPRLADQVGDLQQDLVAGLVPVGVVEEPEIVDVEERNPDASVAPAGRLERLRQEGDDRAVIEHPSQRVAPRRLEQLAMLPGEPYLRRAEEEEQHAGQQQPGNDDDEHDLGPRRLDAGHDVGRVPPEGHHREGRPVARDRQVFLHHAMDVLLVAGGLQRAPRLDERRARLAADGGAHLVARRPDGPDRVARVGHEHAAVEGADFDADDRVPFAERVEHGRQLKGPRRPRPVGVEVGGSEAAVDEEANERPVAGDHAVQRRLREAHRRDSQQRAGGDPDEDEDDAEDERQQHRTPRTDLPGPSVQHIGGP